MRRVAAALVFVIGGMLILTALSILDDGGSDILAAPLLATGGSVLCWFSVRLWRGHTKVFDDAPSDPPGPLWPLLLAAAATTAVVTVASNVALERLTFNCSVEDCSADGYLLLMPLAFVLFWSIAAATSRDIQARALSVSLVVVVTATALNFVSVLSGPPDPDKSFVAVSVLIVGLILGIPIGWVLGVAGAWFGSKVLEVKGHSIQARLLAPLVGASSVMGAASLWLPWIRVHGQFADNPSYVLTGIEVANAGRVVLFCCSLAVLAAPALYAVRASRPAALASLVSSAAATATVVWVLLNKSLFVAAHQVISPSDTELPLRLTDLGPGVPVALAATTLALTCSILALRATSVRRSPAPFRKTNGSTSLAGPDPAV